MAIESLLEALGEEGDVEAKRVVEEARAEAARIEAEAASRVAARTADAVAARERELAAEGDAGKARLRHEGAVGILHARNRLLERVFDTASAAFPHALDLPAHEGALQGLIAEALAFVPEVPVIVRCRPGLAARALALVASLGNVRVESDASLPEGVVVEAEDGSVRIDNTLADRLRRLRPALSVELLARLGERDEPKLG